MGSGLQTRVTNVLVAVRNRDPLLKLIFGIIKYISDTSFNSDARLLSIQ